MRNVCNIVYNYARKKKLILLFILTGMRSAELLDLPRTKIYLDEHYLIGGVKTDAGKNRIIPLHRDAVFIVKYFMETYKYEYLCFDKGARYTYKKYMKIFHDKMEELGLNHSEPYDTRHTFATIAKTAHVEEGARQLIMGHVRQGTTDKNYTHEPLEFLLTEINKINIC